jgi:hypothetical protein
MQMLALVDERIANSDRVTHEILAARPLWKKMRDGIARLFSPLL